MRKRLLYITLGDCALYRIQSSEYALPLDPSWTGYLDWTACDLQTGDFDLGDTYLRSLDMQTPGCERFPTDVRTSL